MQRKIAGENVYLSPISIDEVEHYYQWVNDSSVTDGIGITKMVLTKEHEQQWIKEMIDRNEVCFTIYLQSTNTPIGNCALQSINYHRQNAVLSIYIGDSSARNQGYGREAIELLIEFGFDVLNLRNILLTVFENNTKAIKMYKSVGFETIGIRRGSYYSNGNWYGEVYMDIVREDVW